MRKKIMVLFTTLNEGPAFHFCSHRLLSGKDTELWYPLPVEKSLFQAIENVMVENNQAVNVTRIEKIRVVGKCTDYEVTYNAIEN